jgi:hypothetical protein
MGGGKSAAISWSRMILQQRQETKERKKDYA